MVYEKSNIRPHCGQRRHAERLIGTGGPLGIRTSDDKVVLARRCYSGQRYRRASGFCKPKRLDSGDEQQMVTIARALMGEPHLLLLDQPSHGTRAAGHQRVLWALIRPARDPA